ncbi:MAG: hypothetical protein HPY79_04085 [Bacteroidales bacterium]|nr:hypothetical protein [Bacteroidales bacterium]
MNTNNIIDIADFLNQQLENQQIEPPAHVWDKVQSQIPNYPIKGIGHWIWYSSILLIVGLTLTFYFSTRPHQTSTIAKSIAVNHISVPERAITYPTNIQNNTKPQTNYIKLKSTQKQTPVNVENSVLHLEASVYAIIEKVEFLDSTQTVKKVIHNPTINEFGFYTLDISSLKKGKYQIFIYSSNGKKFQRTENLR